MGVQRWVWPHCSEGQPPPVHPVLPQTWGEGHGAHPGGPCAGLRLWAASDSPGRVEVRGPEPADKSLWSQQPVTSRGSPVSSLRTLPLQVDRFLGMSDWICGSGALGTMGEGSSGNQLCPVLAHEGTRSGEQSPVWALAAQLNPGSSRVCPNQSLLQPRSIPGTTWGAAKQQTDS